MTAIPQHDALLLWLAATRGNDQTGLWEVRAKRPEGGMTCAFFPADRAPALADHLVSVGRSRDVFVSGATRDRKAGTGDAVPRTSVLWSDCDTPEAVHRVSANAPLPSIIVRTGGITDGVARVQALWQLSEPLDGAHVSRALHRLAYALGSDPRVCDRARILRPPGTFNHKYGEPRPVECTRCEPTAFTAAEIVGDLPDPPNRRPAPGRSSPPATPARGDDVLRTIPATEYVPALLGVELDHDGKVCCPFHADRTPSLHCYAEPERGFFCFGCGRGGTAIDFAAAFWDIEPRGRGFHDIRRRLAAALLGAIGVAA